MATEVVRIPHESRFGTWFPDFLKKELAPYPGRGALVARTVIAATLSMILIVTFRIPGGVIGALSAFVLSRENVISTARSAIYLLAAFIVGGLFIPVGARFLASTPETHFFWVGCSLFIVFFLLRTLANYGMATGLALVVSNVIAIWYLPGPAERNVELTLWQVAATFIGVSVTLAVEIVFYSLHGRDDLVDGLDARLAQIEAQMANYAGERLRFARDKQQACAVCHRGASGALRRHVARANYDPVRRMRLSTLVSLTGRAIDFAAALSDAYPACRPNFTSVPHVSVEASPTFAAVCACMASLARRRLNLSQVRERLCSQSWKRWFLLCLRSLASRMRRTRSSSRWTRILLPTAFLFRMHFSNPEAPALRARGNTCRRCCATSFMCRLRGPISPTSVTTCVLHGPHHHWILTDKSNCCGSRDSRTGRDRVRPGCADFCFLPYIDSISGFTVLFASATAVAAWIGTSSSRLSYAGVQFAFAFYLIHLSEFSIQTSLSVGRDRALGVLLGITMMWLVFERLFPRSASDEMIRLFSANLRQLAELVTSSPCADDPKAIVKIRRERSEEVYRRFGEVNAQSDAVPFETGAARAGRYGGQG